ncbi:MAG: dinitrogenase iron-molybdenum cofactor biosynthesis protein [Euryarchaeota archaeon]|nr:dinitrogenase iron-molybdenum cofactor biosynthesis protein [Euryarchaeota archaeon]
MIICVPTEGDRGLDEAVCQHFGRATTFTLYDIDTGNIRVVENRSEHMGGVGTPPEHLSREGVNIVIAGGLGPKAIDMLNNYDIEVFVGAGGTVREAIELWRNKSIERATRDNACRDHAH